MTSPSHEIHQVFTIGGSTSDRYTVESVEVVFAGCPGGIDLGIYTVAGNGRAGTQIGRNLTASIYDHIFTASGITLNGGTSYALKIVRKSGRCGVGTTSDWAHTTSGTGSGWNIANRYYLASWSSHVLRFSIDVTSANKVSLSASSTSVTEGSNVLFTATLSRALGSTVEIPIEMLSERAESGDYGFGADFRKNGGIIINAGQRSGSAYIRTRHDTDDTDNESFFVLLEYPGLKLPMLVSKGNPSFIRVVILDDENITASVSLSANQVIEGNPGTVTARLSRALPSGVSVNIPVILPGRTENISITAPSTTGTLTVPTSEDDDTDNGSIFVRLDSSKLPFSGSTSSHVWRVRESSSNWARVGILDDDITVRLSVSPRNIPEGDTATVTASLSGAAPRDVTIPVVLNKPSVGKTTPVTLRRGDRSGTGTITANQDSDTDDESFWVWLDVPSQASHRAKLFSRSQLLMTIQDDDRPDEEDSDNENSDDNNSSGSPPSGNNPSGNNPSDSIPSGSDSGSGSSGEGTPPGGDGSDEESPDNNGSDDDSSEETEASCDVGTQSLMEFVECAAEALRTSDTTENTDALLEEFRGRNWNDGSTYLVLLTKEGEVRFHAKDSSLEGDGWSGFVLCEGGESVLEVDEGCSIEHEGVRSGYAHPFSASGEEFVLLGGFDETPSAEEPTDEEPMDEGGDGGCAVAGSDGGGISLAALALLLAVLLGRRYLTGNMTR